MRRRWRDKLLVWLEPPGWRPADVAARFPKPAFDLAHVQRYDPPLSRGVQQYAGLGFVVLLAGVGLVLWFAHQMATLEVAVWSLVLIVTFWSMGAVLQSRLSVLGASMVQAALLATATATLGLQEWHYLFNPTMVLAVWLVINRSDAAPGRPATANWLLAAALTASLAGDVFLMLPINAFIPGSRCRSC